MPYHTALTHATAKAQPRSQRQTRQNKQTHNTEHTTAQVGDNTGQRKVHHRKEAHESNATTRKTVFISNRRNNRTKPGKGQSTLIKKSRHSHTCHDTRCIDKQRITPPHPTSPHPTPIRIYAQVEIAAARAEKKTWEAEDLGEPSASLFLGNLSWSIDEESIRKLFEGCGEIQRIKWHEREGQFTGKAFLDFDSVDSATKAAAKSGQDLKGRPVRITFSKGGNGGAAGAKSAGASGRVERPYKPEGAKPDGCVELFCGNLPWSIDDDKIADFFKGCGTVTATRWLNDKETGDFKGVGWVTFSSTEEVDKAVEMGGEQLDGRPIRIDYAGQKKAAAAWGGGGSW